MGERALPRPPGESTRGIERKGTEGGREMTWTGSPKIYDRSPPLPDVILNQHSTVTKDGVILLLIRYILTMTNVVMISFTPSVDP